MIIHAGTIAFDLLSLNFYVTHDNFWRITNAEKRKINF